jgi:CubicO group peptidase (beta-lactamase class C family)
MPKQSTTQKDRGTGVGEYPPVVPRAPWRVAEVEALAGWRLRVRHNDGVAGVVDMSKLVHAGHAGMFAALRDESLFSQVYLDLGAVTWPGEIDLAPDAMHDEIEKHGEWVLQ